jgi:ubiquinone/menaquinone biosynthesis C-methylase UbiE
MDDPRLASARLHADVERLRAQVGLSWPKELAALRRLGLADRLMVLEAGSGPGFITERLLEALPHGHITAVELDPTMTRVARERLAAAVQRGQLEIVDASILHTDRPSEAFDFALARLVLQHVAAPDLALSEIHRLLAPGGVVAVVDVDDALGGLVSPRLDAFELVGRKVRQAQASRAGDREIGRKLWRLLADSGFTEVGLEAIVFHSDELGLQAFLPQYDPERYRAVLAAEDFSAYEMAYREWVASPDAYVLQVLILAYGRKPAF